MLKKTSLAKRLSEKQKEEILSKFKQGYSIDLLAKEFNCTNLTISRNLKKYISDQEFKSVNTNNRDKKKNALAIMSKQSSSIDSYEALQSNYKMILENNDLTKCPDYWGGFSFNPFYFEFWEGHESRLNKRETYEYKNDEWVHGFLQS